jgi:hypothetical protein
MHVSVSGAKDRELVNLLKLAADSFADKLLSPQLKKNISIKIKIDPKLEAGGYCDSEEEGLPLPRSFIIEIRKTRKKIHMFSVLAHEMVHLKQMAYGEMKDKYVKHRYVTIWQGDTYEEDVSYWDQPWEQEAYGLENSLLAKFLIEHNQFKNLRQKEKDWFVFDDLDNELIE